MNFNYILHEYAQQDYEESIKWYLEKSIAGAEKLVNEIDFALQLICKNPGRWRNKYKNFHEISLKKYPFTIIYTIESDKELVIVSSIYHHKRNPKAKYRKLK